MSDNASIGNLYITVKADGKQAINQVKEITAAYKKYVAEMNQQVVKVKFEAGPMPKAPTPPKQPTPPPTAPKPPTAPRTTRTPLTEDQKALKDLEARAKGIKTLFEGGTRNTDATRGLGQLGLIPEKAAKLKTDLENLRIKVKTDEERAAIDRVLADIAKVKREAENIRLVVKQDPSKVGEAGSVKGAFDKINAEKASAEKAQADAAKTAEKARADAAKTAEKARADAAKADQKAQREAAKIAERAQREAEKADARRREQMNRVRLKGIADAKKLLAKQQAAEESRGTPRLRTRILTRVDQALEGRSQRRAAAAAAEAENRKAVAAAKKASDALWGDSKSSARTAAQAAKKELDDLFGPSAAVEKKGKNLAGRFLSGVSSILKGARGKTGAAGLGKTLAEDAEQAIGGRRAGIGSKIAGALGSGLKNVVSNAIKKDMAAVEREATGLGRKAAGGVKKGSGGIGSIFSAAIKSVGSRAKEITQEFSTVSAALGAARSGNFLYAIAGGFKAVIGSAGVATKSLKSFGDVAGAAESSTGPLGAVIGVVVAGALAAVTVLAVKAALAFAGFVAQAAAVGLALKSIFSTGFGGATELEKSTLTLKAILGSRTKAEQEYLIQRDRSSLYDFQGIQNLDRTLLAFNVTNDQTRRGLIDTLVVLGTVGGRSVEQLEFAARAFGQISAAGRPYRQDVLQLVQSLGLSEEVLKELPEYANLSSTAIRKLFEEGKVSSDDFFRAVFARRDKYGAIADEAAQTFEGQINNIKDSIKTGLSKAFIDTGVLAAAAKLASGIRKIFEKIDFKPIGRGFAAVVSAIAAGFGQIGNGKATSSFKQIFEVVLPNALYKVARLANFVATLLSKVFTALFGVTGEAQKQVKTTGDSVMGLAKLGATVLKFFVAVYETIRIIGTVIPKLLGSVPIVSTFFNIFKAIFSLIKLVLKIPGVKKLLGVDDITDEWDKINKSIDDALAKAAKFEFPTFTPPQIPDTPGLGDGTGGGGDAGDQTGADEAAKKIDDLRNELYELTRRIYGLRSELEKGLLGDKGFEATKEQIAQMGDRVVTILRDLGKAPVANAVDGWIISLMKLADMRDKLAKKLEDATQKLDDAIKARDDFAQRIKQQTIDFVNALRLEERSVEQVQTFQFGGIVGYLVASVKKSDSFVEALRKRLTTVREFTRKTDILFKRGLDRKLLEQLVAAGPEEAGTVVDQLVNSGDTVIREVNKIQKDLGRYAVKTGNEQADKFYAAGVAMAKAQAEGLKSQIAAITKVAEAIGRAIYNAIVPFAKKAAADSAGAIGGAAGGGTPPRTPTPPKKPPTFLKPGDPGFTGPPAPGDPGYGAPSRRELFMLEILRRAVVLTAAINERTQIMQSLPFLYTDRQIQDERKFNMIALAKALGGYTKSEAANDYSIDVYIGGQKIGEYVDYAIKDKYGRQAKDLRTGTTNPLGPINV